MPLIFRERGFRFHFYSNEINPREPAHVHVAEEGADAKLWLYPMVCLAYNKGFDARTQAWLLQVVAERRSEIEDAWNDHFGTSG